MRKIFLRSFKYLILLQSKVLDLYFKFKYRKFLSSKSISGQSHVSAGETMFLNSQEKLKAQEIIKETKIIFKEYLEDPRKVFEYIQEKGTPVFKMEKANWLLWFLGEDEGFITAQKGFRALFLSLTIKIFSDNDIEVGLKTPGMFLMRDLPISPYTLAYQLYHWMAYSKNLGGYDEQTIKNFKNIWALDKNPARLKKLSLEEILSLKEAIARDVEAIDMVKELAVEVAGQKKAMNKMKKNGDAMI